MFNYSFFIYGHLIYISSVVIYGIIAIISFNYARKRMPLYIAAMWTGLTSIFSMTMWEYYVNMSLYYTFFSLHKSDPSGWLFDWQLWGLLSFLLLVLIKYDFNIDWSVSSKVFLLIMIMFVNILAWIIFPEITNPYSIFYPEILTDLSIFIGSIHRFVGSLAFTMIYFGKTYEYKNKSNKIRIMIIIPATIIFIWIMSSVRLII